MIYPQQNVMLKMKKIRPHTHRINKRLYSLATARHHIDNPYEPCKRFSPLFHWRFPMSNVYLIGQSQCILAFVETIDVCAFRMPHKHYSDILNPRVTDLKRMTMRVWSAGRQQAIRQRNRNFDTSTRKRNNTRETGELDGLLSVGPHLDHDLHGKGLR